MEKEQARRGGSCREKGVAGRQSQERTKGKRRRRGFVRRLRGGEIVEEPTDGSHQLISAGGYSVEATTMAPAR